MMRHKESIEKYLFIIGLTLVFAVNAALPASATTNVDERISKPTGDETLAVHNYFLSAPFHISQNAFTGDLTVHSDDALEGDLVVYSGDVLIEEGGKILGNLIVMSGDIEIEAGGRVEGDVTNFSGDVTVAGKIQGNLAVASGDVDLESYGAVEGDVSVWSGEVNESVDSRIGGELRLGPNLGNLPTLMGFSPSAPNAPAAPNLPASNRQGMGADRSSPMGTFFGFLFRLLGAGVMVILVATIAGCLTMWRPHYVESVRRRLRGEVIINLAVGILFNLVLGVLMVLFAATCILIPMAILGFGLLVGINGAGWTALSASVGRRMTGYTDIAISSTATVVLGALLLTAPFAALWAMGGCLRFIGGMSGLGLASIGAGTVLVPWLRRLSSAGDAVTVSS